MLQISTIAYKAISQFLEFFIIFFEAAKMTFQATQSYARFGTNPLKLFELTPSDTSRAILLNQCVVIPAQIANSCL